MGNTQATPEKHSMEKEAKNKASSSNASSTSSAKEESAAERLERLQSIAASVHQEILGALADLPHTEQTQACQNVISQITAALSDAKEFELRAQTARNQEPLQTKVMAPEINMAGTNEKKMEDIGKKKSVMDSIQATSEEGSMEKEAKSNAALSERPSISSAPGKSIAELLKHIKTTQAEIHKEQLKYIDLLPAERQAEARQRIERDQAALSKAPAPSPVTKESIAEILKNIKSNEAVIHQEQLKYIALQLEGIVYLPVEMQAEARQRIGKRMTKLSDQEFFDIVAGLPPANQEHYLTMLAHKMLLHRVGVTSKQFPAISTTFSSDPDAMDPLSFEYLLDTAYVFSKNVPEELISTIVKLLSQKLQNLKKESKGEDEKETGDDVQNTPSTSGPPSKKPRMD